MSNLLNDTNTIHTSDSDHDGFELNFFPLEALEQITSNPLERCDSNISYTSQEGNATFVPFGPGHVNSDFIDFSLFNKALDDLHDDDSKQNEDNIAITNDDGQNNSISNTQEEKQTKKKKEKKVRMSMDNLDLTDLIKMRLPLNHLLNENLICRFFKDQHGSRYAQNKLKSAPPQTIDEVLKHIIFTKYEILNLSNDVYGNYVIQMIFEIGNHFHHKLLIHHLLRGNVLRLTRSFYGCRVIQTALSHISHNECISLVLELNNRSVTDYVLGQNAHHVIQKVLSLNLDVKHIKFIINCVDKDIFFFSSHIFGCRVVQSILNNYAPYILSKIVDNKSLILKLCTSEYGNYVIQDLLSLSIGSNVQSVVKWAVFENVSALSKNKFGSNVVEKCLLSSADHERDIVLQQMIRNVSILIEMVHDKYGNYVIQKLLIYSNHRQQSKLIDLLQKNIPNLISLKYGKHIMDKIKTIKSKYKSSNRYF